jgi:hypothetical protein
MGQYHHPVCIDAEEGLNPAGVDSSLKEGEQGFSRPSTPNAIVALVCARGGNMPADCSQSPLIGRWAGKRVLIQGDYAEDNDIPGWKGPRLSKLYRAMTPVEQRKPKKNWRTTPVFADITREACAFLEAACNVRYFEHEQICKDGDPRSKTYGQIIDRWTSVHSVAVKPVAQHFGNCGVAEYVIADIYDARDLEYLKRCGMQPEDVQRPPRSGDWHGFLPEEVPEGQTRVIVNLDTFEYGPTSATRSSAISSPSATTSRTAPSAAVEGARGVRSIPPAPFSIFSTPLRSSVAGPRRRGIPPRWRNFNESTVYCRLAECEDRAHPRVDCRPSVMLAGLRTLRKWLLR